MDKDKSLLAKFDAKKDVPSKEGVDNPGFQPSSSRTSLLDVTQKSAISLSPKPSPRGSPLGSTQDLTGSQDTSRRSSVAEVAFALSKSRSAAGGGLASAPERSPRGSRIDIAEALLTGLNRSELLKTVGDRDQYAHPFGNTSSILEELVYGEPREINEEETFTQMLIAAKTSSSMKLVGWIVGLGFFVMITGAIIFGAETWQPIDYSIMNATSMPPD